MTKTELKAKFSDYITNGLVGFDESGNELLGDIVVLNAIDGIPVYWVPYTIFEALFMTTNSLSYADLMTVGGNAGYGEFLTRLKDDGVLS